MHQRLEGNLILKLGSNTFFLKKRWFYFSTKIKIHVIYTNITKIMNDDPEQFSALDSFHPQT